MVLVAAVDFMAAAISIVEDLAVVVASAAEAAFIAAAEVFAGEAAFIAEDLAAVEASVEVVGFMVVAASAPEGSLAVAFVAIRDFAEVQLIVDHLPDQAWPIVVR